MSKMHGSVRFIHTSDWQLGMTRAFLSEEASSRFGQARIDAIERLGTLALEHEAAFIVVAGDIFESNQLSRQTVARTLDALESLQVPVFLLPGNHDPLDASSILLTPEFEAARDHIVIIRDTQPIPVPGLEHIEVVGAPWPTKHPSCDLIQAMAGGLEPTAAIRVAVGHGQTDNLSPDKARPEIIDLAAAEAAIAEGRFHYLALGDRHSVTNVGDTGKIWFSGAPVATAFDEVDPNKALLVQLDHEGDCKVEPLQVGEWTFIVEQRELNSEQDLTALRDHLTSIPNKSKTIVKIGLTGSINLAVAAELDTLLETLADSFASIRLRKRTTDLAIVPDELDNDSVNLSGYAKEVWQELISSADTDSTAQDALRLLYRLTRQGAQA